MTFKRSLLSISFLLSVVRIDALEPLGYGEFEDFLAARQNIECGKSVMYKLSHSSDWCPEAPVDYSITAPAGETDRNYLDRCILGMADAGSVDFSVIDRCRDRCFAIFEELIIKALEFDCVKPAGFSCPSSYICPKSIGGIYSARDQCTFFPMQNVRVLGVTDIGNNSVRISCRIVFPRTFNFERRIIRSCGTCANQ